MALVNALLVRWAGGYTWRTDASSISTYGRREGFLALGAVQSLAEARRVADAVLANSSSPRISTTAAIEPSGSGDVPYDDWDVADYLAAPVSGDPTTKRVMALTVTEDAEGNPIYVPELGSLRDDEDRRLQRWLKRMANGTLGGSVESATPYANAGADGGKLNEKEFRELPPWTYPGEMSTADISERWYPPFAMAIRRVRVSLVTTGSTDTIIGIVVSGTLVETFTLAAGANTTGNEATSIALDPSDYVQVVIVQAGTDASDLSVQMGWS